MKLSHTLMAGGLALAMSGPALAESNHIVLFELTDNSEESVQALLDGAWHYLAGIDGITHFEVGSRQGQREGGSVLTDFDVMLSVTFETEEAHIVYDTHPDHMAFIGAFRENWASVRVMDTDLSPEPMDHSGH